MVYAICVKITPGSHRLFSLFVFKLVPKAPGSGRFCELLSKWGPSGGGVRLRACCRANAWEFTGQLSFLVGANLLADTHRRNLARLGFDSMGLVLAGDSKVSGR